VAEWDPRSATFRAARSGRLPRPQQPRDAADFHVLEGERHDLVGPQAAPSLQSHAPVAGRRRGHEGPARAVLRACCAWIRRCPRLGSGSSSFRAGSRRRRTAPPERRAAAGRRTCRCSCRDPRGSRSLSRRESSRGAARPYRHRSKVRSPVRVRECSLRPRAAPARRGRSRNPFTSPRSQVVRYCGGRFSGRLMRRGLGFLATTIIHEELHSLGLGEDPPSAQEISRRVEARCGS
jgi:hypothetical protein